MRILLVLIFLFSGFCVYSQNSIECCLDNTPNDNTIEICTADSFHKNAQDKKQHPSRDEIMAQKVAFITQELELTPAEAEKFWPVYNENSLIHRKARKATMQSLTALNKALESNPSVSDSEIKKLTVEYLNNFKYEVTLYVEIFNKYQKILPLRKAVKIFNAEEKFRVYLIKNLRGDKGTN